MQSRIPIAVAQRTTVWQGDAPLLRRFQSRFVDEPRRVGHDLVVDLNAGESVTVENSHDLHRPRSRHLRTRRRGDPLAEPTGQLRRPARRLSGVVPFGERFDIDFDESPDALRGGALHLPQLLQSAPNRAGTSTPPFRRGVCTAGLSGHLLG